MWIVGLIHAICLGDSAKDPFDWTIVLGGTKYVIKFLFTHLRLKSPPGLAT